MINLIRWLSASHLSKWAWGKWYCWHSKVSVLRWPSQCNRPGMKINKNKDKCDDFTFRLSTSLALPAIFQHDQGGCVVCNSIYGFWLPHWYLQTLFPLKQIMYSQTATVKHGHIRQVVAKYRFISYEMNCKMNLKLRSRNASYCLIEVVTKAGLTVT